MKEYLTVVKAAELKGCARLTIYKWIKDCKLNVEKIGGRNFVVKDSKFENAKSERRSDYLSERIGVLEEKIEQLTRKVNKGKD